MKKSFLNSIFFVLLTLVGCEHNTIVTGTTGELEFLSLLVDGDYIVDGEVTTRDEAGDIVLESHIFAVDIYDASTGELVESYSSHRDMPSTIVLESGLYRIEVYTANVNSQVPLGNTAGFDQPQYGATEEVEIVAGETTPITMTAVPTTAAITVSYSVAFEYLYPCEGEGESYYTIIYSSHGAELTFVRQESRTAYFEYTGKGMELLYKVFIVRQNSAGELETITTEDPTSILTDGSEIQTGYLYNFTVTVAGQ